MAGSCNNDRPCDAARFAANVAEIRGRIAETAEKAHRAADEIRLVAITKYGDAAAARALLEAGCADLGESRPQELWAKAADLAGQKVTWHLVGHLQRNKIRRTLPLVALVHSADSERLIATIDTHAADLGLRVPVLLEVNISGEAAKHGFSTSELKAAVPGLAQYENVEIRGLMAMSGRDADRTAARRAFARVRRLRDELARDCPAGVSLDELSMGMTQDFEEAIFEGATILRIGSALFGGIGG